MATLLKRLSVSINEKLGPAPDATPRAMASCASFNDFSLHCGDEHEHSPEGPGGVTAPIPTSLPPLSLLSTSAPTSLGLGSTAALKIPRSPMAQLLSQRSRGTSGEAGTPRSSLDVPSTSAAPTPRASFSSPRSPGGQLATAADEPASPRSPRSPTTPGGRRRKAHKIDGMDYYEFCELIRSSSL